MAFDVPLFDKALPGEVANVAFHLRTVAMIGKAGEIVCRHEAELAQVGECTNFGIAQGTFPLPTAIDRSRAVGTMTGSCRIGSSVTFRLAMRPVSARSLTGPFHQVGTRFSVPSLWECEVGNAIG